jgi:mRNA interferase MazF
VKRGEIWWAELPRPAGRRPVILLSRDEAYEVRRLVTVAPVTTRVRGIPVEVPLGPKDGMPQERVANLDTVTTIPKDALRAAHCALPVQNDRSRRGSQVCTRP